MVKNNSDKFYTDMPVLFYIKDCVGSYTRPAMELKGFKRVKLTPGSSQKVTFSITSNDLRFWTRTNEFKAEPGKFEVWIGGEATGNSNGSFTLVSDNDAEE
jgi:beta-glucosidase